VYAYTLFTPEVVIAVAGIIAVSCWLDTNVVGCTAALKYTTEPALNPLPFTVSINCGPIAVVLLGKSVATWRVVGEW
jgi:hypothetical protein